MSWYQINNPETVASPALLVYPERIKANIQEMLNVATSPDRLRPHIKTHKCREIVAMQQDAGISKFKCATIAEAELLAECEVGDVLLAYQPTGPNIARFMELANQYPDTEFSALVDNMGTAKQIDEVVSHTGKSVGLFIDLDVGMHRTGTAPGPGAQTLSDYLERSKNLKFRGWHIYDGHIGHSEFQQRREAVTSALEAVKTLTLDHSKHEIVAGGTPTFPVHALHPEFNLSPGTCLLWDQGYSRKLSDQNFIHAAVLLTRVISKPGNDLLCLDLGHKAVASEMPHPRVYFPDLEQVEFLTHSEEHLVIRCQQAQQLQVGDVLYGIPMHICPTVALHQELVVIEEGEAVDGWKVYARNRRLSV